MQTHRLLVILITNVTSVTLAVLVNYQQCIFPYTRLTRHQTKAHKCNRTHTNAGEGARTQTNPCKGRQMQTNAQKDIRIQTNAYEDIRIQMNAYEDIRIQTNVNIKRHKSTNERTWGETNANEYAPTQSSNAFAGGVDGRESCRYNNLSNHT